MPDVKARVIRERIDRELDSLRARSQFRTLDISSGVNLSSNDYLGLSIDPRLRQSLMEAVERTPLTGSTGSRLLTGNSRAWQKLESTFAEFAGTEAALYFGSGYAANIGLLSSLLKPDDVVFSDALNHASLIDGIRLSGAAKVVYPHCDLQFLEHALRKHADIAGAKIIVTESVFSMEGDCAPLEALSRLAREHGAEIILDEAHATGVCGPQGRGVAAEIGCGDELFATVHTCGKALASAGAFVCGSAALSDYLVNHARTFIFSTAMPPYMAGQIQAALSLAREAGAQRTHLRHIASELRKALIARTFQVGTGETHIVPVILGTNEAALHVAGELQRSGFAVKAIRPPTVPVGTARIRFSLTSQITLEDVHRLVAAMDAACESLPRFNPPGPRNA